MQSVSTGIARYLSALDPSAGKTLRAARNNRRFAAAVERVWDDNPLAGDFVLAHVNSLYFAKDETPRKGQGKDADRYVLGVYVDDPAARAELNARRETLALALMQDGFRFDEIRIIAARLGMRERRAFPAAFERVARVLAGEEPAERKTRDGGAKAAENGAQSGGSSCAEGAEGDRMREQDESRLLQTFKRAACQAIGDIDQAASLLSRVEGASLVERYPSGGRRQRQAWYACQLRVASPDAFKGIFQAFGPSIIAHAKELGLNLVGIDVVQSIPELAGNRAFPASGSPKPYRAETSE
ncbi:MAG TPA: hypothetical protein IAC28_00340 [Candidatus Aphodovivens excrementavium]|nr:hypothetical protein [Candidatus Aphodovivens excrementavium]